MTKNYTEELVEQALCKELQDNPEKYQNLCKCKACLAAVKAGALNRLRPFYVTGLKGQVFGEAQSKDNQQQGDILVALISAIYEHIDRAPHGGTVIKSTRE